MRDSERHDGRDKLHLLQCGGPHSVEGGQQTDC